MGSIAKDKQIINNINSSALTLAAIEALARETLSQKEASPAVTALLAKCLLHVLHQGGVQ